MRVNLAKIVVQWLKLPAWKVGDRGFERRSGIQVSKKQNVSSLLSHKYSILWGASEKCREVSSSTLNRQGSNFKSCTCIWRAVSSHSSHHPQEVLLAKFSIYVHKGGIQFHSFYLSL